MSYTVLNAYMEAIRKGEKPDIAPSEYRQVNEFALWVDLYYNQNVDREAKMKMFRDAIYTNGYELDNYIGEMYGLMERL